MQYVIFVHGDNDEAVIHTAPVAAEDAAFLQRVIATMKPLSEEDYMNGPAIVLHTLAKYSYILDDEDLYWCVEWDPGFLVVRFSPDGQMAWTAIRSPVPNFGGRDANEADWDDYDEDAPNPQYNLIFDAWDSQFDAQDREWRSFAPADLNVQSRFEKALAHVNELGAIMEERFTDNSDAWSERCEQNLEKWCGEGIRLK
jgi:hypothetical protein